MAADRNGAQGSQPSAQKENRAPSSIRRGGAADVAWPKNGEVSTPLKFSAFVWLSTLKAWAYSSTEYRLLESPVIMSPSTFASDPARTMRICGPPLAAAGPPNPIFQ